MTNVNVNTISRFAGTGPGTFATTPTTLTAASLNSLGGLAFDARGDLFVANQNGGSVTEFAAGATPGTFGATTTLTDRSLVNPRGLAVDVRGNLFDANYALNRAGLGSITEFASTGAGTFGSGTAVETSLQGPLFLAFSPVPAVPEASTTVSLGLLLALGLGGLVAARKRKA